MPSITLAGAADPLGAAPSAVAAAVVCKNFLRVESWDIVILLVLNYTPKNQFVAHALARFSVPPRASARSWTSLPIGSKVASTLVSRPVHGHRGEFRLC